MSLTSTEIRLVLEEIAPRAARAVVRAVYCSAPQSIVLELRARGDNVFVGVCATADATHLYLATGKPKQPPEPPAFVMLARKHLLGCRVVRLHQLGDDRLVRFDFERFVAEGEELAEVSLVAELMGRRGALALVQDALLLGAVSSAPAADRERLTLADEYQRPTMRSQRGGGEHDDRLSLAEVPPDGSRSARIREHFSTLLERRDRDGARRRVASALTRRRKRLEKRLAQLDRDLRRALEADEHRRRGQLLMGAYGKALPRDAAEVRVVDYSAEGMPLVSVPLLPELDLQGNIDRYFAKARRGDRAIPYIDARQTEAENELSEVVGALERVEALTSAGAEPADFDALYEEVAARGLVSTSRQSDRGESRRKGPAKAEPFRRFRSQSGLEILVGKGGRDNDTLSLKVARGNDVWMHARDWAGAHVVIRLPRGTEADDQALLDAAALAAHYSKGRGDSGVEVLHTRAKHVRKSKGMPPGRVSVAGGKTIVVGHDPARIERLFQLRDLPAQ